jgi:hypothetical protein
MSTWDKRASERIYSQVEVPPADRHLYTLAKPRCGEYSAVAERIFDLLGYVGYGKLD